MKPIRTEAEYKAALARVDALMGSPKGSPKADELGVLVILIEKYEEERFPFLDVPVAEVLKLVMEENGLTPKDMAVYLGSPSTVSKVLSGQKELTLLQIRTLHEQLRIPVEALIGTDEKLTGQVDWTAFPLVEMARRGLFGKEAVRETARSLTAKAQELVHSVFDSSGFDFSRLPALRQGLKPGPASDPYAVLAWLVEVAGRAKEKADLPEYCGLDSSDLRAMAKLSTTSDGMHEAIKYLEARGVPVVIVPHYKRSRLDGGVVMLREGRPAIGLTLRYDRIDAFWFNLLHEAAHIARGDVRIVLAEVVNQDHDNEKEQGANRLVEEATIPAHAFSQTFPNPKFATLEGVIDLAQRYGVHVAIAAGRVQYKSGDYRKFARLVGQGKVHKAFGLNKASDK